MRKLFVLLCLFAVATQAYQVRRNVKDFGAVGDGVHDDSAAFIAALTQDKATKFVPNQPWSSSQYGCQTTKPSIVVVPPGVYLITQLLPLTYYTQFVGESYNNRPVIHCQGSGFHCLDAGTDEGPGNGWYGGANQDNFYRQLRNMVIDLTNCTSCLGLHWQVSQATNIVNVKFVLGDRALQNTGLYMESGSGGYMGDLAFVGGQTALSLGNQQFSFRNISITGAETGVSVIWNWAMTFTNFTITETTTAFYFQAAAGTGTIVDTVLNNVGAGIIVEKTATEITLDGFVATNTGVILQDMDSGYSIPGSSAASAKYWMQGNLGQGSWNQGSVNFPPRPKALLREDGTYFGMMRPDMNASGDAIVLNFKNGTDITTKLTSALAAGAKANKAVFLPYGVYYISDTVLVPAGTVFYGEVWSRLLATGPKFANSSAPIPLLQVGKITGEIGKAWLADLMLSNSGPIPGAILLQWNLKAPKAGDCGIWDVHVRLGGFDGSEMPPSLCPTTTTMKQSPGCLGPHTQVQITDLASVYIENMWGWAADHDIDRGFQVAIYTARGFFSTSQGPVWLYGTAMEHAYLYQYSLRHAQNHLLSLTQIETAYYQPEFLLQPASNPLIDPPYRANQTHGYALYGFNTSNIVVHTTAHYSFFNRWSTETCSNNPPCQRVLVQFDNIATTNESCPLCFSNVQLSNVNTRGVAFSLIANGAQVTGAESQNGFCFTTNNW